MPKSCCVKSCSNSRKNNKNVKFQERIKDKGRRKLWLNATGQLYTDKGGNINKKRIWPPKSLHVYVC